MFFVFVLIDPVFEVTCTAGAEYGVVFVGEDIDVVGGHLALPFR